MPTGTIKPVCHRSKFPLSRAYSPMLLPTLSPKSPLKLPKISSEGHYKIHTERKNIVHKSVKLIQNGPEQRNYTPFFLDKASNNKEITFGTINTGENNDS